MTIQKLTEIGVFFDAYSANMHLEAALRGTLRSDIDASSAFLSWNVDNSYSLYAVKKVA